MSDIEYEARPVLITVDDLKQWHHAETDGRPASVSGPCPRCHHSTTQSIASRVIVTEFVAPPVAPTYNPRIDETKWIHCDCHEDHKGRRPGIHTGCGAKWLITLQHEGAVWRLLPGNPKMAEPASRIEAQVAGGLLKSIRTTAQGWNAGVAALLGLFSLSGAVVAKDSLTALSTLPKIIVAVLAGLALVAAIWSIVTGYDAAYGWPLNKKVQMDNTMLDIEAHEQNRVPDAVKKLHMSVRMAIATLVALSIAFGVICFWPAPTAKPAIAFLNVTYGVDGNMSHTTTVCGQLTDLSASGLSMTIGAGPNTIPAAWVVSTAVTAPCST